jgi:hypothetical protein
MFTGTSGSSTWIKKLSRRLGGLPLRSTLIDLGRAKQIIPIVCWVGRIVPAGVESQR